MLFAATVSVANSVASAAPSGELLKLAEGEFSNLTPAETALLKVRWNQSFKTGWICDCGTQRKS